MPPETPSPTFMVILYAAWQAGDSYHGGSAHGQKTHAHASLGGSGKGCRVVRNLLVGWFWIANRAGSVRSVRFNELHFTSINFFLRDLADFSCSGLHQSGSATGELAGAPGSHQDITVIAVKTIFQLHDQSPLDRSRSSEIHRRKQEYP